MNTLTRVSLLVGAVLSALGFVLAFTTAPLVIGAGVEDFALIGGTLVTNKLLLSQKIFYFHMPVAVTSFVALLFTAYFSVRVLMTRHQRYDARAQVVTQIALLFVVLTMLSGILWERYEWGVWWTWEPRLTTYFILMLLVIGYFILRASVSDPERRAVFSAVLGILAFIDVPICFMITRLVPTSLHPVIFRTDSGLPPPMLIPLLLVMAGMFCVAFALYHVKLRERLLAEQIDVLKDTLEASEASL
jgi:heme exporter protein C